MLSSDQLFVTEMQRSSLRVTKTRREIFNILNQSQRPLSIQEIVRLSVEKSHFTSIYRSVESLARKGILREVPRGFKTFYELGEVFRPHHHHATCEICGQTAPINNANVEQLLHDLTLKAGLTPTKHHFELFGICRRCSNDEVYYEN